MSNNRLSFLKYLQLKDNKTCSFLALIIGLLYFILLLFLYPVPSFYADSFTWIGAAISGQPVTFRPIGYSKLLIFFSLFSSSDIALIAGQYFCNLLANLFLFYTCTFLFPFKKNSKILLYLLLITNPFYLFYSNYISSDAFFNCFTVIWFTLLIWIMYKPSWRLIIAQLILLAGLFELRYNAVFFPAISALALLLSKQNAARKITGIVAGFSLIGIIVISTTHVTENFTGTKTFSAFSGWQLANNALHVLQHDKIDTSAIEDKEVKGIINFTVHFFDTAKQTFPDSTATAVFMWHINSPLKRYMHVYPGRSKSYFKTWNALGPVYNKFGEAIILQRPGSYMKHFVLPNAKAYLFPELEIYSTYFEDNDTIARVALKYFHYKTNKASKHHPVIYSIVFTPMQYLFIAANIILLFGGAFYILSGKYKRQLILYNHILVCFAVFFVVNFFFIVLLAPTVMRYHIFILTLSFPMLLYLVQQLSTSLRNKMTGSDSWKVSS